MAMQATKKPHETSKKADCLSRLPDIILHRILFFAGARQAVQTSVLSTRWRYTWTSMPDLHFEPVEYPSKTSAYLVDKVLELHDRSDINSLHLTIIHPSQVGFSPDRVRSWIRRAAWRNVRELFLNITSQCYDHIRSLLADCGSLQVLKLHVQGSGIQNLPDFEKLPKPGKHHNFIGDFCGLRVLSISGMMNCHKHSLEVMTACCPLLEELSVSLGTFSSLSISSNHLKRLVIHNCVCDDRKIRIATPTLLYLDYTNASDCECSLENLFDLVSASICITDITANSGRNIKRILEGVFSAYSLTLSGCTLEGISQEEDLLKTMPTFRFMKHVKVVTTATKVRPQAMAKLLQRMPHLQNLVIHKGGCVAVAKEGVSELKQGPEGEEANEEEQRHLKVEMRGFGVTTDEIEFLKFLSSYEGVQESVASWSFNKPRYIPGIWELKGM